MGIGGTLQPKSFGRILEALAAHTGLGPSSIFVDVGAGTGRALLQVLLSPGVAYAWGIEFDPAKCDRVASVCTAALAARASRDRPAFAVPHVRACDVADIASVYPTTHAYSFWEGMAEAARCKIGQLFSACPSLAGIAVVQRHMGAHPADAMRELYGFCPLELVAAFEVHMSGSGRQFQAYVFRRVGLGRRRRPFGRRRGRRRRNSTGTGRRRSRSLQRSVV